jgi:hypothetical protein
VGAASLLVQVPWKPSSVDGRGARRQGRAGHRDHPRGDQRHRRGAREDGSADHDVHPVPLTAKLVGELSLLVYVPVKPMVTDPLGAIVALYGSLAAVTFSPDWV